MCGTFSYEKALRGPVGQLPVSLSGSECHRLVSSREYTNEKKKTHSVKVPGLNKIAVDEIGWESSIDGDQRCQGQLVDIDGHPVHRVVEYSTVVIVIKAEEFVMGKCPQNIPGKPYPAQPVKEDAPGPHTPTRGTS